MKKKNGVPTREMIHEALLQSEETALLMDGFDEAFIGLSRRTGQPMLAVYSYDKMVALLISRDEMTYDDAVDYIEFNCLGAWVGEQTPVIVQNPFDDMELI